MEPVPGKLYRIIRDTNFCNENDGRTNYEYIKHGLVTLVSMKKLENPITFDTKLDYMMSCGSIRYHCMEKVNETFWEHFESLE